MNCIEEIEKSYLKSKLPEFRIGDVVDVHIKLKEGEKERIQIFTGTVIGRKGCGLRETFTVRRIVAGEGVERIFPLHTPTITGVIVKRPGRARRAKLYYLRERVGKSTKTKERRTEEIPGTEAESPSDAAAAAQPGAPKKDKKAKGKQKQEQPAGK